MQNSTKKQVIDSSFVTGKCGDLYVYSNALAELSVPLHPQLAKSNAHPEGWGWPDLWSVTTHKTPLLPVRLIHQYIPLPHNYMYGVVPAIYEVHFGKKHFWFFTLSP
tara:strand:+ start:1108 stop:1428 length:321 start_codon:yes stop_codon:yes gene_type:complete